ncbi:TPA: hypothetical protein L5595_003227 [Pseudomonas aeruginosa]|nr:hypothetical protein [Pseudomonas aeruginosa]
MRWSGRTGLAGSVEFKGCQAARGGDSPQGFPSDYNDACNCNRQWSTSDLSAVRAGYESVPTPDNITTQTNNKEEPRMPFPISQWTQIAHSYQLSTRNDSSGQRS